MLIILIPFPSAPQVHCSSHLGDPNTSLETSNHSFQFSSLINFHFPAAASILAPFSCTRDLLHFRPGSRQSGALRNSHTEIMRADCQRAVLTLRDVHPYNSTSWHWLLFSTLQSGCITRKEFEICQC